MLTNRPTLGLALSGSGNRSGFYIGFLEVLQEQNIQIDYIAAMSGASIISAAYACGALQQLKEFAFQLNKEVLKKYIVTSKDRGGMYSLRNFEEYLGEIFRNQRFEDVYPKLAFVAVDIETGEQIILCMGDLAKAVCISCTLPGIFEPVKWGGRTLVDGGLLNQIPLDVLKNAETDIMVGVNMRGTKHIFTEKQIALKKIFNLFKKYLFIDGMTSWVNGFLKEEEDVMKTPGIFSVLGKSLDLAAAASGQEPAYPEADLTIVPELGIHKNRTDFDQDSMKIYYELGRNCALEHVPRLRQLLEQKANILQKELA